MKQGVHPSEAESASVQSQTLPELRATVKRLEGELEDRKLFFVDLCEQSGTSPAATPASAAVGPTDAAPASPQPPATDLAAEARELASRNAFLTAELRVLAATERQNANDPRVIDKRNEVRLVRMQVAQVEREIATLQTVKKRRDVGLRAIGKSEEEVRQVRGRQHEMNAGMREEVKRLMEELRGLEKIDLDVHERCARLQDQVKLSVTDADVQAIHDEIAQCESDAAALAATEAAWRQRRASVREEDHRVVARMRRECAAMEGEVSRLQKILMQKDLELKRSYQGPGRFNALGGGDTY